MSIGWALRSVKRAMTVRSLLPRTRSVSMGSMLRSVKRARTVRSLLPRTRPVSIGVDIEVGEVGEDSEVTLT